MTDYIFILLTVQNKVVKEEKVVEKQDQKSLGGI